MRPPLPLPEQLLAQARAYADGSARPAEPRDAATVVLLRDAAAGLSAYLLRRHAGMAFAGGMCVFPGGGVDARDFEGGAGGWVGPAPADWARRLGTDPATARALVYAACRETFEESGVLLAGESADTVVADTTGADWEADRTALEAHDLAFTDFLQRRGLVLRTDLLGAWAGWLTPVFEPRRYRTWFFVAELPRGQRTRDVSSESDRVGWAPVEGALAAGDAGEIGLMPPTYLTLVDVARFGDVAAVMTEASGRAVEMFTPTATETDAGWVLSLPPGGDALLEARR